MKVAITGGRYEPGTKIERVPTAEEMQKFWNILWWLGQQEDPPHDGKSHRFRHGAARGTDSLVAEHVRGEGMIPEEYRVDQGLDGPWPAAGLRRNGRMLKGKGPEDVAEILIPFPGGKGTADCVRQAGKMGVRVIAIEGWEMVLG